MTILIIIAQIIGVLGGGFLLFGGLILANIAGGEISDVTAGMDTLGCLAMPAGVVLAGFSLWGLLA